MGTLRATVDSILLDFFLFRNLMDAVDNDLLGLSGFVAGVGLLPRRHAKERFG